MMPQQMQPVQLKVASPEVIVMEQANVVQTQENLRAFRMARECALQTLPKETIGFLQPKPCGGALAANADDPHVEEAQNRVTHTRHFFGKMCPHSAAWHRSSCSARSSASTPSSHSPPIP